MIIDPPGGIYKDDEYFRDYFLTLLLNAVNAAIESPTLRSRISIPRQQSRLEELRKLSHILSLSPIPEFNTDLESINSMADIYSNAARSESIASNTTGVSNETISSNSTRRSPTPMKKFGLSKRIFGVFSGRSMPVPLSTNTSIQSNGDGSIVCLPATSDSTVGLVRPKDFVQQSKLLVSSFDVLVSYHER
jgi:hypothetical protein